MDEDRKDPFYLTGTNKIYKQYLLEQKRIS
jgi:hypothetical protein